MSIHLIRTLLIITFLSFFYACERSEEFDANQETRFTLLPKEYTGVKFQNKVREETNRSLYYYDYFYNGGGIAIGDINNDNLPDLFFAGNDSDNRLYINKGDLKFTDVTKTAGIKSNRWATGVTMVDINQDGWLDIYVCNSGDNIESHSTKNELYINTGKNTFVEKAKDYGIDDDSRSTHASFFDMDNDGDLDLWVVNHGLRTLADSYQDWFLVTQNLPKEEQKRESNSLFRNDGNGRFTDVSNQAGIEKIGFGLGVAVRDFNEDGYLDVYVANDFMIPDFLYINNGDGTFSDRINEYFKQTSYYSMGCDAADINNDGLSDLVVVDMTPKDHIRNKVLMASMDVPGYSYLTKDKGFLPQYMFNSLFINNGNGVMSNIAQYAKVAQTDWSWAPLLADFDNDGYKDLFITNGFRKDTKDNDWRIGLDKIKQEKGDKFTSLDYLNHLQEATVQPIINQVFKNTDGLSFVSKTEEWGFVNSSFSNGAAYGDLDKDGDLDLVVNNFDESAFIYRNNTNEIGEKHFIRFQLKNGDNGRFVKNSSIYIYYGDTMQMVNNVFDRGYQSYVEPIVHFGLGSHNAIDSAVIIWLDNSITKLVNPKVDLTHKVEYKKSINRAFFKHSISRMFKDISSESFTPDYIHSENSFGDFDKEVLLPHKQSTLGPCIAVADVNADGLEDFFIGGAFEQSGVLYLQGQNKSFVRKPIKAFELDADFEDNGAKFIDIDGDGDLDLYVASGGGGEVESKTHLLQDRIYINDGLANFISTPNLLPKINSSTQAIASGDIDGDGDLDLFIGGRTTPGRYPISPNSYILINEGGYFKDMTEEIAPGIGNIGMITDVEITDLDGNSTLDLLIVGEWMPITVYLLIDNKYVNKTKEYGLKDTEGWWYSLTKADFDKDGDFDFVAGNIGLNNKFQPSKEKPLFLYANDFDSNGTLDIVLSKIYKGKQVPVRGRECSSAQMPYITEKFPSYESFATASLNDIYGEEMLNEGVSLKATEFASLHLENIGSKFKLSRLVSEAQLAPINSSVVYDFDNDGYQDIVIAGNMFQTEVETPKYSAGKGMLLTNKEGTGFQTSLLINKTGLKLDKDVKQIASINLGVENSLGILIANNSDTLQMFRLNKNH